MFSSRSFIVSFHIFNSTGHFEFIFVFIAQLVKNPPAMQETPVQFLGQEDLLEKG